MGLYIHRPASTFYWSLGDQSSDNDSASSVTANTWYHVAWTRSGSTNDRLYVNGSVVVGPVNLVETSVAADASYGIDAYSTLSNFDLFAAKIWSVELTAAEVAQERWAIRPVKTASLWRWVPCWNATNLVDLSGNNSNPTVGGTLASQDNPPVSWGTRVWVVPFVTAGGGGVTGAGAVTLGSLTASGAGAVAITGASAVTFGALIGSAAGAVAVVGSGVATLGALALAGAGATAIAGAGAITLDTLTAAGAGAVAVVGSGAATLGTLTASGAGVVGSAGGLTLPTFRSSSTARSRTSSITATLPDGATQSDEILAYLSLYSSFVVNAAPTDWTQVATGSNGVSELIVYRYTVPASPPSDFTWTLSGADDAQIALVCYQDVDDVSPVMDYAGSAASPNTGTPLTIPSVTLTAGAMVVAGWGSNNAAYLTVTNTNPAGWTTRADLRGTAYGGVTVLDKSFASSGATGTANVTVSAGYVAYVVAVALTGVTSGSGATGSAAITLGTLTAAGAGTVAVTGAGAATLGAVTLTSAGAVAVAGNGAATLGGVTLAASGAVAVVGAGAATLGGVTVAGAGAVPATGAAGITLDTLTSTAAGVVAVAGSASVTLGAVTVSASGTVAIVGAGAVTLGAVTTTGAGVVAIVGAGAATLGAVTVAATGAVGNIPITGGAAITLGALSASGAGTVAVVGSGVLTLGALTAAGTGVVPVTGAGAATLGALTLSALGGSGTGGQAAITLGTLTLSAAGVVAVTGASAITLDAVSLSSAGTVPVVGAGAATLGALTSVATGVIPVTGAASVTLGVVTIVAAGYSETPGDVNGAADIVFGGLSVAGVGVVLFVATFGRVTGPGTRGSAVGASGVGTVPGPRESK
jgi:fibronectin-binding autotransporter adhesin